MNAALRPALPTIEPRHFPLAASPLARLALTLERERRAFGVEEVAFEHGVDEQRLRSVTDVWSTLLEGDATRDALRRQPWFTMTDGVSELSFVHRRAPDPRALPLLLLHGAYGSVPELAGLAGPLSEPASHGGPPGDAFHVVCPSLPGFGLSRAQAGLGPRELASVCHALMSCLGYERYVVHGSDVGASVAAELAALAPRHVLALHVTSLQAFPDEGADDLLSLTSAEKSQLALLTFEHDELDRAAPSSPLDELAAALIQLADWDGSPDEFTPLLHGLTVAWAFGDAQARRDLTVEARLRAAPHFEAPLALETYPLDVPCLRRFVARKFRVAASVEHERGGRLPALERPAELVTSLRRAFAGYR